MSNRLIVCALLGLVLLTGCAEGASTSGQAGDAATPGQAASPAADKRRARETLIATCMKQKGFSYVAYVRQPKESELERRLNSGDYAAMKETRAKYGFGVFASVVYPTPENADKNADKDPNEAIAQALPSAQKKVYDQSVTTCYVSAVKQVFGLEIKSIRDFSNLTADAIEAVDKELNGDAELVRLSGAFADCLSSKGERVASTRPLDLAAHGPQRWVTQLEGFKGKLSPEEARPYLTREIKAALDDLECGKDFYAVFSPMQARLRADAAARFGFLPQ
ncbi:hypothetical protein [Streptosporangium carneum]|uniref:Uncharacterized protein n=1 Tax=Streptosporangium carneum TaxID=47481 RepID=A0A9W6MG08_9ACTN|nr:hypothetical protein [Streptosporangium carneum]GLK13239.1 hypothetical protein GCM10017600_66500 [Streptosporangium carneum]